MKTFPMFLKTSGKRIVILGGGEQAAQKCRLALKTDAEIWVAAPHLEPELAALVAEKRITHIASLITLEMFNQAALAFVATGCRGADAALSDLAKQSGVLVNVVDAPELCDAFTPSIVDRDPVVVAIGTEGAAPVLARQIKTRIEEMLEPRLGDLAALAGRLRGAVAKHVPRAKRRSFWRWVFTETPRAAHARGSEREAAKLIKEVITAGGAPGVAQEAGFVSLVGAGPGARDLITLRGVQRLQEADVIFYDRLVDVDILELARRDAERVYVGKTPGASEWPQERINTLVVNAARSGQRVVRLKCGDPGIFARGAEEAAALTDANVAWEIVPGVTAASAAGAELGGFLTERGATDALMLATGRGCDEASPPCWADYLPEGATMALYMAVGAAERIQSDLLDADHPPSLKVEIVSRAGAADSVTLRTSLKSMVADMRQANIQNPAIILIRRPKTTAKHLAPFTPTLTTAPTIHRREAPAA
ncbi:MAG: siroheme synthase CysG [Rhodobacteraceae bacterium]|nr:siroheme synthase CysG [Paracoccaceae bacterium]